MRINRSPKLLAFLLLAVVTQLPAAEGTSQPNVLDGLTFTGTITLEQFGQENPNAKAITLVCVNDEIKSTWLAKKGIAALTCNVGGFSGSGKNFHIFMIADAEKTRVEFSIDNNEKISGTLIIENEDGTNQIWKIEAKRDPEKRS